MLISRLGLALITGVAVVCQLGDHPGHFLSRPESPLQAHAVWHVLMATAAWLPYRAFMDLAAQSRPAIQNPTPRFHCL